MARYMSLKRVIEQARAQIEGLQSRPELEKGLMKPLATLEAELEKLVKAEAVRAEQSKAAVAATEAVQQAAFEMRQSVRSNIHAAARRRGRYAPELVLLGGKPRRNGRRSADIVA